MNNNPMKKIFLLLALCATVSLWSQENKGFGLTLNHVALSVKDVHLAAEFYKNILGFEEITNRTKKEGIRWFSLGDGKELHLISTIKTTVTINKAVHLALTTPNFDAFVEKLQKMNIPFSDWEGAPQKISIRADGIKQIYFQDLDYYWIEVNSVVPSKGGLNSL